MTGTRIRALDGLRAVAIVLVIVGHGIKTVHPNALARGFAIVLGNSMYGVEIFFVLSGYLITSLLVRELDATATIDIRRFYMRRVRRILPPFYVWLAIITLLYAAGRIRSTPAELAGAATFTFNYLPPPHYWWLGNTWSLCIEEQFYLIFPALMLMFGYRNALVPLVCIVAFEPIARAVACGFDPARVLPVLLDTHLRIDAIAYGCILAIALRDERIARRFRGAVARRSAIVAAAIGGFGVPMCNATYHLGFYFFAGISLESASAAVIVGYVIANPRSRVSRALSAPPLAFVGTISYSLYLWQQPFTTTLNPIPFPLNVAGAFLFAWASYRLIERPMAAVSRRIDGRREAARTIAPAPAA